MQWVDEAEPFPAFLQTCSGLELAVMQHDARAVGDDVTLQAVLRELKRRASEPQPSEPLRGARR